MNLPLDFSLVLVLLLYWSLHSVPVGMGGMVACVCVRTETDLELTEPHVCSQHFYETDMSISTNWEPTNLNLMI